MLVDWTFGEAHLWIRHGLAVTEVQEAVDDPGAVLLDPDPKSRSGDSARVIGFCASRAEVLVVIVVRKEDGHWWGATAWVAGPRDREIYDGRRADEQPQG
jgi:uncharacterized DUF497 family protein